MTWYSDSTLGAFGARYSGSVWARTSTSFLKAPQVLYFKSYMIKTRSLMFRAEVILDLIGSQNHRHGTIRKINVRILPGFFFLFKVKYVDVKLRQGRGIHCADGEVFDAAWAFVFRLGPYTDELFFTWLDNIEICSLQGRGCCSQRRADPEVV